eukprot:TRINITY_DN9054_c0_g1_i2.p1 TRINITY_DN9054_c0_g1~~TRINITY_DN9054_c0_g1_i2.p1  ORF type:complete len:531 (+),score=99.30 TRINITY_DN9054_c0_g1_i2:502-2094(+)
MRVLEQSEVESFRASLNEIASLPGRDAAMTALAEQLEKNLTLLGATAVEDRLQDEVPETIADLLKANVKFWMLTGDKLETAENVARSCRLVQADMSLLTLRHRDASDGRAKLDQHAEVVRICVEQGRKKAYLIEGEALGVIFADPVLTTSFLEVASSCEAVVCCRVTPKQKAEVVRQVKTRYKKVTLAIGDGANDVNMIQEANIGIGIFGNEGVRAASSADFALPNFKGLWRLLLVHGRWSYVRIGEMILYFFYKNMAFTIPQFYYSFYCAFSGQTVFDDWYLSFYNMFFTSLPLVIRAVFEQDVNYKERPRGTDPRVRSKTLVERLPLKRSVYRLYYIGQENRIFNQKNFLSWVIQGLLHGAFIYFGSTYIFQTVILTRDGYNGDMWVYSITLYTCVVLVVSLKLALHTKYWTTMSLASFVVTIGFYYVYTWFANYVPFFWVYRSSEMLHSSIHFYATIVLLVGGIYVFELAFLVLRRELFTTTLDFFRHLVSRKLADNETLFTQMIEMRKPSPKGTPVTPRLETYGRL